MRAAFLLVAVAALLSSCAEKVVEAHKLPGEHIMSKKAQTFLDQLDEEPAIEELGPMQPYFYRFYNKGIEFYIDGDTIVWVMIYSKGVGRYTESYSGKLPYGLTMSDTRSSVEKKLGRPAMTEFEASPQLVSYWTKKQLNVVYQSADPADMDNKIHHIMFYSYWLYLKNNPPRPTIQLFTGNYSPREIPPALFDARNNR